MNSIFWASCSLNSSSTAGRPSRTESSCISAWISTPAETSDFISSKRNSFRSERPSLWSRVWFKVCHVFRILIFVLIRLWNLVELVWIEDFIIIRFIRCWGEEKWLRFVSIWTRFNINSFCCVFYLNLMILINHAKGRKLCKLKSQLEESHSNLFSIYRSIIISLILFQFLKFHYFLNQNFRNNTRPRRYPPP